MPTTSSVVTDPFRLAALERLGILDTPAEEAFDRLTRLATRILCTPIALVTIVDGDRQFFKSQVGLPEPWASLRETPLSHSFCQYVVETREPLVVEDARMHALVRENLAIRGLGVVAYAGVPLLASSGVELGSFCVIDTTPRRWTEEEVSTLRDLASSVVVLIEYRAALLRRASVPTTTEPTTAMAPSAPAFTPAALLELGGAGLFRLALAVTGDEEEAEEAVVEGVRRTCERGAGCDPGALRARLAVQTRSCALEHTRRSPARHPAVEALARLPEAERCVVELACYARLSVAEIAAELGLPAQVVMARMSAGLRAVGGALR